MARRCSCLLQGATVLLVCLLTGCVPTTAQITFEIGRYYELLTNGTLNNGTNNIRTSLDEMHNLTRKIIRFNETELEIFQECLCSGEERSCLAGLTEDFNITSIESSLVLPNVSYTDDYLCEYIGDELMRCDRLEDNPVTQQLRNYSLTASFLLSPPGCNLTTVGIWYRNSNECIIVKEADRSANVTILEHFCPDRSRIQTPPPITTPGPTLPYDVNLSIRFGDTGDVKNMILNKESLRRFHYCLCNPYSRACLIRPIDNDGLTEVITLPTFGHTYYTRAYMCYYKTIRPTPAFRCDRMELNEVTRHIINQASPHHFCVDNEYCELGEVGIIWNPNFNQTLIVNETHSRVRYTRNGCN